MSRWTREEYQAHLKKQMAAKPSKYKAVKTVVDGITFDSKKEAQRYRELKLMEKAGQISDLVLQPIYPLVVVKAGSAELVGVGSYRADFAYTTDQGDVIEDVKGMKTPVYRLKKKLVEAIYGITIRET